MEKEMEVWGCEEKEEIGRWEEGRGSRANVSVSEP